MKRNVIEGDGVAKFKFGEGYIEVRRKSGGLEIRSFPNAISIRPEFSNSVTVFITSEPYEL